MPLSNSRGDNGEETKISRGNFCRAEESKWDKRVSAKICSFLQFSAKICASDMLKFPDKAKICKNRRKSAKNCV